MSDNIDTGTEIVKAEVVLNNSTAVLTGISKSDPEDAAAGSSSTVDENPPILKMFEREDWTLFRTVEGLQQKAGVPASRLRRLVLKELGDNALDTGAEIKFGQIADSSAPAPKPGQMIPIVVGDTR
jgi:hypothetical protein